jgi:hypothetical protein
MNKLLCCLFVASFAAGSTSVLAQTGGVSGPAPVPAGQAMPKAPMPAEAKVAGHKAAADEAARAAAKAEQKARKKAANKAWRERTKAQGVVSQ